ncbi:bifunctional diguanylate cyclase/phosphodiesterase [Aliivibrio sifiae]|uniref:Diguanylate cyclase n=1 Tax=Aliivibrio sifiae TaxID=566293 RepID=A0A2S7X7G1_9GAMM|nr:GGDEF domain-containing protein [Aliivibrio sifiae]PQJ87308.1 diguanylate cyclase [Aliivibrio sifiae]GLR76164.1 diguanylate cyclase [Aliivibrio sifiae]
MISKCSFLYQPKIQHGKVIGAEALLRIPGVSNIENYISLITNKSLFDYSVIKKVLLERRSYHEYIGMSFPVSINISIQSLESDFFVEKVSKLLVNESDVTFEITENDNYLSLSRVKNAMTKIKSLGVKFSLDDFGKGFSDIEQVLALDFDEIKIDGSLVKNIENNFYNYRHLKYILDELSDIHDFHIVIERVETNKQLDLIESYGKTLSYQGFLFSKPLKIFDLKITGHQDVVEKSMDNKLILEKLVYDLIKNDDTKTCESIINEIHVADEFNNLGSKVSDCLNIPEVKLNLLKKYNKITVSSNSPETRFFKSYLNCTSRLVIIRDSEGNALFNNQAHIDFMQVDLVGLPLNKIYEQFEQYKGCIAIDRNLIESKSNFLAVRESVDFDGKIKSYYTFRQKINHYGKILIITIVYDEDDRDSFPRDALTDCFDRTILNSYYMNNFNMVAFIDMDGFKKINDKFGHKFGDNCLNRLVGYLKNELREEDLIIRYGGDEFLIFTKWNDINVFKSRLELIRNKVERLFKSDGIALSFSFGIDNLAKGIEIAINCADERMYLDKNR